MATFVTRQNEAQYGVDPTKRDDFYAKLQSGQNVGGRTWTHNGQGWQVEDSPQPSPSPQPGARNPYPGTGQLAPSPVSPITPTRVDGGIDTAVSGYGTIGTTPTTSGTGSLAMQGGGTGVPQLTPTTGPGGAQNEQLQAMFRKTLLDQLGQANTQPSLRDPEIAAQSEAFSGAAQRQQQARRAELAFQGAREGTADSGGMEQKLGLLSEQTGQAIGANDAALIGQAQDRRVAQLTNAMNSAKELGLTQEANALQLQLANLQAATTGRGQDVQLALGKLDADTRMKLGNLDASTRTQLAQMDADLQRQGYSTQERIAAMDAQMRKYGIDVQGALGKGQLSLDLFRTLLTNQQFNDQLGFDIGKWQSELNRDALLGGLRG